MTVFNRMLVLKQEDYVVGMFPKADILGVCFALDDENVINIYLRDGRIVKHYCGEYVDDEIAKIAADMGWD